MSKIKFAPNGIGSGEFTISAPGTSTNRTINLPDLDGTLILSDASGNVGIGTTSGGSKLEITAAALSTTVGSQSLIQKLRVNAGNEDLCEITNTRQVAGASWNGAGTRIQERIDATYMAYIQFNGGQTTTNDGGISFGTGLQSTPTAVVERIRIDSSGNVGIGTTAGNKLLHVYRSNTDQTAQVQIEQAGSGSPTLGFLKTGTFAWLTGLYNSDNSYRIAASGTDLNTSTALTISSTGAIKFSNLYGVTVTTPRNVFVDASGNIGGISSIRASKTNIASMSDANWVLDLNPVTFNYRKKDEEGNFTEDFDSEKMYGLIAEDAAEVNPDICIYNEVDGEQKLASIHYDRLIAPIIQVLKNQQEMIKTLQAQVAELQGV